MDHQIQQKIIHRKNYFPAALLTLVLWSLLGSLIYFFSPQDQFTLLIFFLLTFLALFFSLSLILAKTRRGFLLATGITLFLLLRYLGQGHILNAIIILSLLSAIEFYFSERN